MRYLYAAILVAVFVCGVFAGRGLAPWERVREVPGPTVTTEVEKVVTKTVSGDVTTRVIERKVSTPVQAPKPQYRLGALLPIGEPKDVSVTAARRVVGNVWVESQYNIKRKEVLIGLSYEW